MNEAQIKHMVDRFLGYRLPDNFNPDGGVSYEKFGNKGTPHQYRHQTSGTNLLDATQADAMVRHMIEGMPAADTSTRPVDQIFDAKSERRDADGNIIPWAEEHDYFMAFDPENPNLPMD